MAAQLSCIAYIARPRILATGGDAWRLQSVAACPSIPGVSLLDAGDGSSFLVTRAVGTTSKLLVAREMRNLEVIGYDLVASALNGLVASGAKPSFFSHTDALGDNEREMDELLSGVTSACIAGNCPINRGSGKKTPRGVLAGMALGEVRKELLLDGRGIQDGDWLIGLETQALHSQKFGSVLSLAKEHGRLKSVGKAILTLPRIYVSTVLDLIAKKKIKAAAHFSSAGITDAIAKLLGPREFGASIRRLGSWPLPPVLVWIKEAGDLSDEEMLAAFNVGLEMVLVCDSARGYEVLDLVRGAHHIGSVIAGSGIIIDKLLN
ncbi:hypothetical protein SELMODRAFT_422140 [Selaginella moellendorffii]|uniref:phosphoribosylformylglycinamidine cyclo-ligase n=1 Tax=Selaginella moellendorffii TaxID=88036 RepID=D8SHG8_SELML|nr:hypothetical protein SELMODRAFT_422140 [Selaginella moellendorffii]